MNVVIRFLKPDGFVNKVIMRLRTDICDFISQLSTILDFQVNSL